MLIINLSYSDDGSKKQSINYQNSVISSKVLQEIPGLSCNAYEKVYRHERAICVQRPRSEYHQLKNRPHVPPEGRHSLY